MRRARAGQAFPHRRLSPPRLQSPPPGEGAVTSPKSIGNIRRREKNCVSVLLELVLVPPVWGCNAPSPRRGGPSLRDLRGGGGGVTTLQYLSSSTNERRRILVWP